MSGILSWTVYLSEWWLFNICVFVLVVVVVWNEDALRFWTWNLVYGNMLGITVKVESDKSSVSGVTPLHIAVVNQNINLVQHLISHGGDAATPRVTGLYFRKRIGGLIYYGSDLNQCL